MFIYLFVYFIYLCILYIYLLVFQYCGVTLHAVNVLPFKDEVQTALFKDPVRTAL
jgi:hypothetical protein